MKSETIPVSHQSEHGSKSWPPGLVIAVVGLVILVTWVGWGYFSGNYTALETLFTGLALAGVAASILLQSRELRLQREELALTRSEVRGQRRALEAQVEESRAQAEALRAQAEEIRLQREVQQRQLDILALTSYLDQKAQRRLADATGRSGAPMKGGILPGFWFRSSATDRERTANAALLSLVNSALGRLPLEADPAWELEAKVLALLREAENAIERQLEIRVVGAAAEERFRVFFDNDAQAPASAESANAVLQELERAIQEEVAAFESKTGRKVHALRVQRDEGEGRVRNVSVLDGWES